MDTTQHSCAKNCNVQVDCSNAAANGHVSHHKTVNTSRLILVTVAVLLSFNVVCLSYAFWRLGEQAEEISQLRTAATQKLTFSKETLQRRSDSESSKGQQQQQPHVPHGHSSSSKPCRHSSCKNGNKDSRPPPISLGSTGQYGITALGESGLSAAHLVGSNSHSKSINSPGSTALPFRTYNDGFVLNQMSTLNGALVVPKTGVYFAYAQVYFLVTSNAIYPVAPGFGLYYRGKQIAHTVVSLVPESPYATGYVGRLVCMNQRDNLSVKTFVGSVTVGLNPDRTFFGAFLVSATSCNS